MLDLSKVYDVRLRLKRRGNEHSPQLPRSAAAKCTTMLRAALASLLVRQMVQTAMPHSCMASA